MQGSSSAEYPFDIELQLICKKKKKKNETLYVHFLVNLLVSKQHFKRTQFSCGDNFDVF